MTTSIYTTVGALLTWDQARAFALGWGGDLTTNLNYDHSFTTDFDHFDGSAWVGVVRADDGDFYFLDGSRVRDKYPEGVGQAPPIPNYPENHFNLTIYPEYFDSFEGLDPHPVLEEDGLWPALWGDAPTNIAQGFVWDIEGKVIKASPYNDRIEPAYLTDVTIDMGAGMDYVRVQFTLSTGFDINMGAGADYFEGIRGGGIVRDGPGEDQIDGDAFGIKIIASLDGDDDQFYGWNLSYRDAREAIYMSRKASEGYLLSSDEIGNDRLFLLAGSTNGTGEIKLGHGNDIVDNFSGDRLYTFEGADTVQISFGLVDGGAGDDALTAKGNGYETPINVIGGAGDDVLSLIDWSGMNKIEMTGGSGADRFVFDALDALAKSKIGINDFAANGAVQDILDLRAWNIDANTAQEAISSGQLTLSRKNGYTYVTIDSDISEAMTLTLKGVYGADIYDNIWF